MAVDKGPIVTIVMGLFLALSWITIALRCYVRIFVQHFFGADDALAIAALVSL
jgi:hypothetical protein